MKNPHIYCLFIFLQCCFVSNSYAQTNEVQENTIDEKTGKMLEGIEVRDYLPPVLQPDSTSTSYIVITHKMKFLPILKANFILEDTTIKVSDNYNDSGLNITCNSVDYYIDGIRIRSFATLPTRVPYKLVVPSTSLPAKYGCRQEYEAITKNSFYSQNSRNPTRFAYQIK